MAKYCRKCGHEKKECTCKKNNLNYPMIATIIITSLIVVGLIYFIISFLIERPEKQSISLPQNNKQEENENTTKEEKNEEQEKEFVDWTQMISCTYLPKYNSKNYINYYLKNNKVIRIERLYDASNATSNERNDRVQKFKNEGYKNIKVVDKDIKLIITDKDTLWKENCGDCSANDVYRIAENDFYEYGMTCSTKDNK